MSLNINRLGLWFQSKQYQYSLLLVLVGLGIMTIVPSVEAQSSNDSQFLTIEEVIVTARKREERLQKTPISITAFRAEDLEIRNIENLSNIARFTPNLTFDQGSGNTGGSNNAQVFIRGIGQQDFLFTTDPGVGIYIDGVYFPRALGNLLDLVDLERVEVLRGPQGTLFGRNTIGGAIQLISAKPTNEYGGRADLALGNFNRVDAKFSVNIPFVEDKLAAKISAVNLNRDGYVKRVDGVKLGNINSSATRLLVNWKPADDIEVLFSMDYTRKREESIADVLIDANGSAPLAFFWNALVGIPVFGTAYGEQFLTGNVRTTNATGKSQSDLDLWGASATINWELTNSSIKSITAYREQSAEFAGDPDNSPLQYAETTNSNNHKQFSQELQFSGTGINNRLVWLLGGFYMREEGDDAYRSIIAPGLGLVFPVSLDRLRLTSIKTDAIAAFSQATFNVSERVSLTGGLRYTRDKKEFSASAFNFGFDAFDLPLTTTTESWDAFSGKASIDFNLTDDLMVYASVSRGFKSGGFNGRPKNLLEATSTFDPEFVWTYEGGFKASLMDRRMTINSAVYFNDYTDLQLTILSPFLDVLVENAGQAETKGFEIELQAIVTPQLLVNIGIGYIDAKYTEVNSGAWGVSTDSQFVKTPKWSGNVGAQYEFPAFESGTVSVRADYMLKSEVFHTPNNIEILRQGAYGLLSGQVKYESNSGNWGVALLGTNLTDETYIVNGLESIGFVGSADAVFGRPREWGVKFNFRF